jgi:hypothetical protein
MVRAYLKFCMERVESDAEVGDTASPPRLPRPLLTQELAPHGSRDQSRVISVHMTLPLLPASPAPCSRRNWLLMALGTRVELLVYT